MVQKRHCAHCFCTHYGNLFIKTNFVDTKISPQKKKKKLDACFFNSLNFYTSCIILFFFFACSEPFMKIDSSNTYNICFRSGVAKSRANTSSSHEFFILLLLSLLITANYYRCTLLSCAVDRLR